MYVDAVTTAAVADELNQKIVGGRVQAVLEVDRQSIGFEIYAGERYYLLMSIKPDAARCQLVPDRLRRGRPTPSPLGQLLKKYVDGARLTAVTQPPWERMLFLDFSGHEGETRLIVETMDRRSNIILTVNGSSQHGGAMPGELQGRTQRVLHGDILDSLKRVGSDVNRYRTTLPGQLYVPPPPQNKARPETVTVSMMDAFLQQEPDRPAWRTLVANVAGISPLFAREIIYFASGDAEAPSFDVGPGMIHAAFKQRIDDMRAGNWTPCVVPAGEASGQAEGYVAFAAYPLTHLDGWQPAESISAAMTAYFGAPVGMDAYRAAKGPVREEVEDAIDRVQHKLDALDREQSSAEEIEALRQQGELILAYASTLKPGQSLLWAQYDPEGPVLDIPLDADLTPVENAQKLFERYDKAKRAAEDVPRLRRRAAHEMGYLRQLATDLDLAESWPEIDEVREALQEGGYWRGTQRRGPKGGRPGVRRFTLGGDYVVFVGRNAAQNHELVTERATGNDLWLHARNIPGSHVIVKNDGRPIPEDVIEAAAQLAAYYSAAREDTAVEVDVTERRHVRPIRGGKPGMVTYRNERTLNVPPQKPRS